MCDFILIGVSRHSVAKSFVLSQLWIPVILTLGIFYAPVVLKFPELQQIGQDLNYVFTYLAHPPGQAQRWHNKRIQTWYPFIVPLLCLRLCLSQDRVLLTTIFVVPKVVPLSKFTKEQRLCRSGLKWVFKSKMVVGSTTIIASVCCATQ